MFVRTATWRVSKFVSPFAPPTMPSCGTHSSSNPSDPIRSASPSRSPSGASPVSSRGSGFVGRGSPVVWETSQT